MSESTSNSSAILSADKKDLIRAAEAVIHCLQSFPSEIALKVLPPPDEQSISVAIIGGTACVLHGGDRSTRDVDFVCRLPWNKIIPLKQAIAECDPHHFGARGHSLYYEPPDLTVTRRGPVVIEIIPADSFIWPVDLDKAYTLVRSPLGDTLLPVLVPPALLFSKLVRLSAVMGSDRPRTLEIRDATIHDLHLLGRLVEPHDLARVFGQYLPTHRQTLRKHLAQACSVVELDSVDLPRLLQALPQPEVDAQSARPETPEEPKCGLTASGAVLC